MWVLPFFTKNAFATTLNRRMYAATHIAPVVASVIIVKRTTQNKLLRFNQEVASYLLKKFASDQAIANINSTIFRYTQLTKMIFMQYSDDLFAKSRKVADVCDESTLNDIII